ncbi:choice-of-anchor D domain-containing protein [Solimonas sp. K1W22B-7]|uniref:choice-of-anchor D domain-containing protein n=1 Tax=Solimonas sp. K1W22B-7 TaxID=2303331 RepID=UPI000E335608|nr:choice-of-anchor D domain-containing protein [Solimonas sp. K1W22B-7]AXQ30421.1 choice-of-anchor D domain-containing protein [Solimonas sp. K1W22B-7]
MRRIPGSIVSGAALLAIAGLALAADTLVPRYAPLLISDPPAPDQGIGSGMAVDPDGNYVLAWTESGTRNGGSFDQVLARRIAFDGTPLTAPFAIEDGSNGSSRWPAIASDAHGNFVVAWGSSWTFNDQAIYARRYDAAGNPLDAAVQVSTENGSPHGGAAVAMNPAGDHIVSWIRNGDNAAVIARVFDAQGNPLGPEFALPDLPDPQSYPAGLGLGADRKVVYGHGVYTPSAGVTTFLQCFDVQGMPLTAPAAVVQPAGDIHPHYGKLLVAADGSIFLALQQIRVDNSIGKGYYEIQVQRIAADCATTIWGERVASVEGTQGNYADPLLALNRSQSEVAVSWYFDTPAGRTGLMRRYGYSGGALSDAATVLSGFSYPGAPQLALRQAGFTAAWSGYRSGDFSNHRDVYAQGFAASASQPRLQLGTGTLAFGAQPVGTTSTARNLTIGNNGTAPLSVGSVSVSGDFFVAANGCNAGLVAPGASCTISLRFRPTTPDAHEGTLRIATNAADEPATVRLSGSGLAHAPLPEVSPLSLAFGKQALNTTGNIRSVVIGNGGNAPLQVGSVSVTGENRGDFSVRSNNCSVLQPGQSCSIGLQFRPGFAGARNASLSIPFGDGIAASQSVALSGSGTGICARIAIGPIGSLICVGLGLGQ